MKLPIVVQPIGGLCNRMRCIVGALSLAEKLQRKMIVIWTQDRSLNAKFSDLFEKVPFTVYDYSLSSLKYKLCYHFITDLLHYNVLDDNWIFDNAREKPFDTWKYKVTGKPIFILSNLDILFDGDYSVFRANNKLLEKYNNVKCDSSVIGVHVRRTDNENAIKYSPSKLFLEKIEEEINKDPEVKVYLATDDKNEENLFIEKFGERIIIYEKHSLNRNSPYAIYDAIIDLYNLSHCKIIYGSYYSSFSDTAAKWGNIQKVILKINQ